MGRLRQTAPSCPEYHNIDILEFRELARRVRNTSFMAPSISLRDGGEAQCTVRRSTNSSERLDVNPFEPLCLVSMYGRLKLLARLPESPIMSLHHNLSNDHARPPYIHHLAVHICTLSQRSGVRRLQEYLRTLRVPVPCWTTRRARSRNPSLWA